MNLENATIYLIAGIIALVVIIALWLAKTVGFKAEKGGLKLFASKTDSVSVEEIEQSKVAIENREGQNVSVKKVSENSDVQIK